MEFFMKIVLIGGKRKDRRTGSKGIIGAGHEMVKVGHKIGRFPIEIENREVS